jgi:hypothetical protein
MVGTKNSASGCRFEMLSIILDMIAISPRFLPELLPSRVMRGCAPFILVLQVDLSPRIAGV